MNNRLKRLTDGVYPFHMPGHKRNPSFLSDCPDITEITGADDLHHPDGLIADSQGRAARVFKVKRTFFSTCGSTACILTAISACTKTNDRVLIARNCHRSVYNAVLINSLDCDYIMPASQEGLGCFGEVTADSVSRALEAAPAAAVVITSPTYEGIVSDIAGIADAVHKMGALLIVDAAHGAHLGFSESFPPSARHLGADIVIESAHKTLPCLTQAAFLHVCSDRVEENRVRTAFSVFNTSSPSYPIMASIDSAVGLIEREGDRLFGTLSDRIDAFYDAVSGLRHLSVYKDGHHDKSKILIVCSNADISGFELKELLLAEYRIECEMALPDYVLCMTCVADTKEGFDRLGRALCELDKRLSSKVHAVSRCLPNKPEVRMTMKSAAESRTERFALEDSVGRISADFVYAYPPGSPMIAPGELITEDTVSAIKELKAMGASVYSSGGLQSINVIKTE